MSVPPKLKDKIITRFNELIETGIRIKSNVRIIPGEVKESWVRGEVYQSPDEKVFNREQLFQWEVNCQSLLMQIIPSHHPHQHYIELIKNMPHGEGQLDSGLATLRALKDDFEKGFLDDISEQIKAELTADYMIQAEELIEEGKTSKYNHVPAAVLAGTVLEKTLRELCDRQRPPIPTVKTNGEHKTMAPLIDELKKAGLYNETRATQLRHFAAIRNHAAHGRFDQFNVADVKAMIEGVNRFLSEYMG